jgi:uncharacterized membrane protein
MNVIVDVLIYGIILVLSDAIYLRQIAPSFGKMIEKIQGKPMKMKLLPAVVVYLALLGLWYNFILIDSGRLSFCHNVKKAFLLGFFSYAVYDFTNLALIEDYRIDLAVIDSLWGGLLFAGTTALFLHLRS